MTRIEGVSVQGGLSIGPVRYLNRPALSSLPKSMLSPEEELRRFEAARERAFIELKRLYAQFSAHLGDNEAAIFLFQSMLLDDEDFLDMVYSCIRDSTTAEYAVAQAEKAAVLFFSGLDDSYMRTRAADARDLSRRLDRILTNRSRSAEQAPAILVSEDLVPSDLAQLQRTLLGLVSQRGSTESHTAILARAARVPCLTGISVDPSWEGRTAILDGDAGVLILDPDAETLRGAEHRLPSRPEAAGEIELPFPAIDDKPARLYASISSAWESEDACREGANGVAYLTSVSHTDRSIPPSESEQYQELCDTLAAVKGRPAFFQTLDVGGIGHGTPLAPLFRTEHHDMLKTQLRALLRASLRGPVSLAFMNVESVWDLQRAQQLLYVCRCELDSQKISYGTPHIGAILRSPAAILNSESIAESSDFLILDGDSLLRASVSEQRDAMPSYLLFGRMALQAVTSAHRFGRPLLLSGEEMQNYLQAVVPLLRLGLDGFVVPIHALTPIRLICQEASEVSHSA